MPFENAVLYILLYGTAECFFIRFDKSSTNIGTHIIIIVSFLRCAYNM